MLYEVVGRHPAKLSRSVIFPAGRLRHGGPPAPTGTKTAKIAAGKFFSFSLAGFAGVSRMTL